MGRPSIIVFDLDGTLIEFRLELSEAKRRIVEMLVGKGVPAHLVSPNDSIYVLLQKTEQIMGIESGRDLKKSLLKIMKEYEMRAAKQSQPRKGVPQLLHTLKEQGIRLAVATNTHREAALLSLSRVSILSLIEALVTRDDVNNMKPRGDVLKRLLELLNVAPEIVLYVGDSIHDLQAAREAGVAFIGVEGGFNTRYDLEAAGCRTVIREPLELLRYLDLPLA